MEPVFAQIFQQNKFSCASITCHVFPKTILSVGFNLAAETTMTTFRGVPRNNYILIMFSFVGRLLANDRLFPYLDVTATEHYTDFLFTTRSRRQVILADILQQQQSSAMFSR